MGLIGQQTIKGTFYSYLGVVIGFINLAILSPVIFTAGEIGVTQVMMAMATIVAQLGGLGFSNVTNRLFPWFRDRESGHNGFLSLGLLITAAGFLVTAIVLIFWLPDFEEANREKSELLSDYAYYIPVLVGMIMFFTLLDNFCKVLFNAVIGTFLREVVLRVINLGLILMFHFGIIGFSGYVSGFVLSQAIPAVIIIIYLAGRGEFRLTGFASFIDRKLIREIITLSGYGVIAGLSGIAITNIDKYMVNSYLGLSEVGIYSIAVYFATLILIPARVMGKISVPVVAEAWKRNDKQSINIIYRKSSINQYLIGLLVFLGIVCNMHNIFKILPSEYMQGQYVIILFGLTNLLNVSSGISQYILSTSELYRYTAFMMLLLIVLVLATNILLIPVYGITGAAIASLLSMFVFNGVMVGILYAKFRLWPYTSGHVVLTFGGGVIYLVTSVIPVMGLISDLVIRSLSITVLFGLLVLLSGVSTEVTSFAGYLKGLLKKR
ncbi:MAG: oligosaccharide flippase family protein [Bacteroidales bacterium]|nr:oligosaccharide flippase family protein [Bacteroidales bacterium]